MRKINLQMFAWDPNSVVDYLKQSGQDSSYSARKELAQSMGITNYSGTASQNTQMLNALKNGASSNTTTTTTTSNGPGAVVTKTPTEKKEKEEKESGGTKTTFTPSTTTTNASNKAQEKLEALESFNVEDIISKETWDALNTPFSASTAYQDAMNLTNQLREQLSSGKTSYTDQIKNLLDEIQNRDKFSYDLSNDTLFQQSLASAMASGKTAMQDTMGQAAALTGGYGSTYATSAANQTYNQFIEDAYNNLPEYYQMALQAYEMEGNEMYMELSALNDADRSEYEKLYNAYNANFQNAQTMYQTEYTAWQDKVGNALNSAKLQLEEHGTLFDQAYKTYSAYQSNADSLFEKEFSSWQAGADLDFKYESLAQDDAHHKADLDYKYDALAQDDKQHSAEMDYKYSALEQDNNQFYASLNAKTSSGSGSGSGSGSNSKYSLTDTEIKKITEIAKKYDDPQEREMAVLDYLEQKGKMPSSTEEMAIIESIYKDMETETVAPQWYEQAWQIVDDTKNGNIFGLSPDDNNDTYNLGEGTQTYTFKELKKRIESEEGLTAEQKKAFLDKLRNMSLR